MNLKNFLLAPVFLSLTLNICNAQIIDKVKTLYFSHGNTEFPSVHYDSVVVTKISNDTTWFTSNFPMGQGFYYKAGQKVYKKEITENILLYDYSLVKGDSFFIAYQAQHMDTFIVDSVYQKKMNHRTFKAWHFSNKHPHCNKSKMEWIEGLGELKVGWDTKCYVFADGGWEIKGICLNDSVIYWNTDYNYFKDRNPEPTCQFDSVSKRLNVKNNVSLSFNIYPNPASQTFSINSSSSGSMHVIDCTGKVCMSVINFEEGSQTFDISDLKNGVYLVIIETNEKLFYRHICVVNL